MAHQITLSDEDYAALQVKAAETGRSLEVLVHAAIAAQYPVLRRQQIGSYQLPTGAPDMPEEEAEDERLAAEIGDAHPWASEIVIEDRGCASPMGSYFLDTSALVKRQMRERGHAWIRRLCGPSSGHTIVISEAALVEVPASYCPVWHVRTRQG